MPIVLALLSALSSADLDFALADQRVVELADLVALRQVGVEVVLAVEPAPALIFASIAMPVRTAWRMHSRFGTGSMPGIAASTRLTCALGSAPNSVAAPENSLALDGDLRVDLEADHDLPVAGLAVDAKGAFASAITTTTCPVSRRSPHVPRWPDRRSVPSARRTHCQSDAGRAVAPAGRAHPARSSRAGQQGSPEPRTRR